MMGEEDDAEHNIDPDLSTIDIVEIYHTWHSRLQPDRPNQPDAE